MELYITVVILIILAVPIWLLVLTVSQRSLRRATDERLDLLRRDVSYLESELRRLNRIINQADERKETPAVRVQTSPEETIRIAVEEPLARPVVPVQAPQPVIPTIAAPPPTPQPEPATWYKKLEALAHERAQEVAQPPLPVSTPPAPPQPVVPVGQRLRSALDLEETLGANWLNKVGITLLVLGVASFLIYQFGGTPGGKVTLGFIGGALLLGGGVWLETKHRYKVFARSCIGGGWALLYFTTYAMYHVAAAHILSSQELDLILLLIVSYLMGAHCLYYRSQAACATAFLLAFATVALSHSTVYSLSAGAVLALSMVIVTVKMGWYDLEILGILASYLNHLYWLWPLIERRHAQIYAGTPAGPFSEFWPSTALLIFYWLVFRASYVVRRIRTAYEENVSTVSALLNVVLFLGLMKYQAAHPEWAFYALLAVGAAELLLSLLPIVRARRTAFLMLSTIGVSLLVAAFPFRYSGLGLSVIWVVEAQVLFAAGIFSREIHFRRLGLLAAVVSSVQVIIAGVGRSPNLRHASVFALAALLFWIDAHVAGRRWRDVISGAFEQTSLKMISYLGGVLAFLAAWMAVSAGWSGVIVAALALALALLARRFAITEFVVQAAVYAPLATFIVGMMFVPERATLWHGVPLRLITGSTIALLMYATAVFSAIRGTRDEPVLRAVYTWYAAILVALVAYRALPPMWVIVAWLAYALLLAFAGRRIGMRNLVLQANVLAAAALARIAIVNFGGTALYTHVTLRLITIGCAVALYYALSRWASIDDWEWTRDLGPLHSWVGSILLAVLAWYELRPVSVVPAWTLLGLALFELGLARGSGNQRFQGYAGLGAAFVRMFVVNLNATSAPGEISPRLYTVLPLALALYYVYGRLDTAGRERLGFDYRSRAPEVQAWMATITLAALLRFELPPDWVAAGWSGFVVALITVATVARRRMFLDHALLLGAAVLGRASLYNLAGRTTLPTSQGNLLTVGTAVGILLLALPFAFYMRRDVTTGGNKLLRFFDEHPEQVFFFVPIALLTATLAFEMSKGVLTIALGLEGVAVFILALLAHQRSYRLTGLGLLLACVLKIVCVDVWGLDAQHRYLTLIVLGAALLVVSFLYNRHREALRQLL